jgi:SseB protein N-terminal domain
VTELSGGDPRFRSDRGDADAGVTAALAAYAAGTGSERDALVALASSRLLVPVVAMPNEQAGEDAADAAAGRLAGEKHSEMAIPAIVGHDGRRALPAFTCVQALQRWQHGARPVPVPAAAVWRAAVQESQAVIIDIGGPVPLAVEGARLAALAGGGPVPALHEDADVRAVVAAVAAAQPPGIRIRLGPGAAGADLSLELGRADEAAEGPLPAGLADAIAGEVVTRLRNRVRRGISVRVRPR